MRRLRSLNGHSDLYPVAAEMLEVRALLSATVHAAVAHAEHAVHAASPAAAKIEFPARIAAFINSPELGLLNEGLTGSFSKASVIPTVGKSMSASFQADVNGEMQINFMSGKFTGKVRTITTLGDTTYDIIPSGSIKASGFLDGHPVKMKLLAKPFEDFTLILYPDNTIKSLHAAYVLPNKGLFHGGDVDIMVIPAD